MKHKSFAAVLIMLLLLALTTTAVAAVLSKTTEFFSRHYGIDYQNKLEQGVPYIGGQSTVLDGVRFTLNDIIATTFPLQTENEDGTLSPALDVPTFFATGTISVEENAGIILMPRGKYTVDSPAGYDLFHEDEAPAPPADAPSYADLARTKGATLRMAECISSGILGKDGQKLPGCVGYSLIPQPDGTIFFSAEVWPEVEATLQDCHQLSLWLVTEDVDLNGSPIEGTRRFVDWIIPLTPENAE